jgi:hypothetical protein
MEDRLDVRFQIHPDHRLCDPISHGRHAEHAHALAARLGDLHRFHRRREVAARRQSIPDPIQVVLQILVELLESHSIHPRRTLIGFHLPIGLPYLPLRNIKRLT